MRPVQTSRRDELESWPLADETHANESTANPKVRFVRERNVNVCRFIFLEDRAAIEIVPALGQIAAS
jgi:hypothetical protein